MSSELSKFFHSGNELRQNVIKQVREEVENILSVLKLCSQSVRLYGSSLLIIYCAEAADKGEKILVKVKLVDF